MIQAVKSSVLARLSRAPASGGSAARGGFGSRFAVILSGELIQSLFHFVLNVVLVRTLSQHDYGLFAIVFTSGAVGIAYIRALVAVPATLFLSRSLGRPAERGYDIVFGSGALVVALGMGLLATAILFAVIGPFGALAAGSFIALYAFRSYLRIVLLARKSSRIAGVSDAVYAGVGLLHDAARPLVTQRIIADVVDALATHGAVNTAVPSSDTIVQVHPAEPGRAEVMAVQLDRHLLRRVQTPQGFDLAVIRDAHARAGADSASYGGTFTDDVSVVLRFRPDVEIAVVPGDAVNIKVTEPIDLIVAERALTKGP